jgi:hypothetical protein
MSPPSQRQKPDAESNLVYNYILIVVYSPQHTNLVEIYISRGLARYKVNWDPNKTEFIS